MKEPSTAQLNYAASIAKRLRCGHDAISLIQLRYGWSREFTRNQMTAQFLAETITWASELPTPQSNIEF